MRKKSPPFFAEGTVKRNSKEYDLYSLENHLNVYELCINVAGAHRSKPGQFFMLRRKNSKHTLGRPISVFGCPQSLNGVLYEFMILEKGEGTEELLNLKPGEIVELVGPLGNGFPLPRKGRKVCLVGGGIGVAPVADLAMRLNDTNEYDFYACFKDLSYGLRRVETSASNLIITTESGKQGKKGMLPEVLTAEVIREKGYKTVYACGPTPMLEYVQRICEEAKIECFLSLENFMACGVGACLGCTIRTKDGNKRCCTDGPIFKGSEVVFGDAKPTILIGRSSGEVDLSTEIASVKFKNPVIAASGTFGYGEEYGEIIDVEKLGGIVSKGLTLESRGGNEGRRVLEVPGGMMNSIGLENPGIAHFCVNELSKMMALDTVQIANLSGSTVDSYATGAELLDKTNIPIIELNISCPNVKAGGMAFGVDPMEAYHVVEAVKSATKKPLIVKLTPNAPDIISVVNAVRTAGADAISLTNTFLALAIDVETGKSYFKNGYAGLSGPGIKPIALRIVHQVAREMQKFPEDEQIPIIGLGGISNWRDAVEFIMAGCTAIQVGTATFSRPSSMIEIISGIEAYMKRKGFSSLEDFRGLAL